ncbi:Rieske (2Fe-2S) protein [Bordetella genomosp. 5]|uniref:Rieske (2Fe-2S) protein n=1 Tax=Bordetella genomosp. 5 TaxID=1395608 RepID=A0A261TE57_9BORD|nr:Rieske 2Fe-2S domain-containing protein [Bordetella genomosp. 5]OZI41280.1 Rieske (2Fe-2S) protein [Bordetella genomosp. 5]OZI47936.1 Rieske (2Fe-2S) protein [Bordetella genomosp. 5]
MSDSPAVRVCAASDLVNGGLGVKVPVTDGTHETTVFFVRYQDRAYGYLNRCTHVGVEMDWENSFFTRAGDLIMCARHGATYHPDTGLCAGGACRGSRLTPLQVEEREDAVYWLPAGKIQPLPSA